MCLLAPAAADAGLPANCDAMLTLEKGVRIGEEPGGTRDVHLRLRRIDGEWVPVFAGSTAKGPNSAHMGFVTASGPAGDSLTIRVRLQGDPWFGGEGEAAYKLHLSAEDGECRGSWTGVVNRLECGGSVSGTVETVRSVQGFKTATPGEHPRFLVRKTDLGALRAKADTPWGREMLKELKADKGITPQAFVYALTGDRIGLEAVKARILKGLDGHEWYHIGLAHASAFIVAEHLMAYDLIHDACDEEFHRRMRDALSDKLDLYYWGAQNTQFNPQDTSNWSLMYRSALGFMAMAAMDYPPDSMPSASNDFPRLKPPTDLKPGDGVPVVKLSMTNAVDSWLFAGPVTERLRDDALKESGGVAAARPQTGSKAGDCVFRAIPGTNIVNGNVDLAALTKRGYLRGCYLYSVVDVGQPGFYQIQSMAAAGGKGVRHRVFYMNGHRMETGDFAHLEAGRYPLMVRVFIEPVGNWEPLSFWARVAPAREDKAMAWHAVRAGRGIADALCGANWREELHKKTGWNPEAWGYAQMAAYKAERYCMRGLGEYGWNQEGEAYTRHAMHLGMPFAHAYRNMFGCDIRGADRMGGMLALATAQTVYSDAGARMQSFNIGGGPMDVSLFARGFSFVPEAMKPAVLWAWKRTDALCKAGKFTDPHSVIGSYDGISKVMMFLNWPESLKEQNPGETVPRVVVDRQKGGFVFRNEWKDGDDCVVQLFSNSNMAGGSWASCEGGTFRIDGLGASWAVRGQGYGNGASGRNLPDLCLHQNMVDVGEHWIGGSPQARVVCSKEEKDGSGVVTLDMDEIYLHHQKERVETPGRGGVVNVSWKAGKDPKDLGIHAVRSIGVDYSGKSGAPCLVVVADRLTGTLGSNVWQMATEGENAVTVTRGLFVIRAQNGATLRGTVVKPANAAVRTLDYGHVHEINYHGSHKRAPFQRRAILVDGTDEDQDFVVLMTIQKGDAPPVDVHKDGFSASVGSRKVIFDGKRIAME